MSPTKTDDRAGATRGTIYTNVGGVVIEPSPEAIAALRQAAVGGERVNLRPHATATVMLEARVDR